MDLLDRTYVLASQVHLHYDRDSPSMDMLYHFSRFQKERSQQELAQRAQAAEARVIRTPGARR